jgi:E3 ubiquitin-protein ligase UBR7
MFVSLPLRLTVGHLDTQTRVKSLGLVNFFGKSGWRSLLCQCTTCKTTNYRNPLLNFLFDPSAQKAVNLKDDSDASKSLHEIGMKALERMDRSKALEGTIAYNEMAGYVKEALKAFAEEGKVVTREDVLEIFEGFKKRLEK